MKTLFKILVLVLTIGLVAVFSYKAGRASMKSQVDYQSERSWKVENENTLLKNELSDLRYSNDCLYNRYCDLVDELVEECDKVIKYKELYGELES